MKLSLSTYYLAELGILAASRNHARTFGGAYVAVIRGLLEVAVSPVRFDRSHGERCAQRPFPVRCVSDVILSEEIHS